MICSKCGTQNPDDANFCIGCGARFVSKSDDEFSVFYERFGSFGERLLAFLLDALILGFAGFIIGAIFGGVIGLVLGIMGASQLAIEEIAGNVGLLLGITLNWLYFTILESSTWQATFGKKTLNLNVTDLNGNKITFGRANARYWSKFISSITLGIGYIMAAFTEKHQALHDMIGGTIVMKKK